MTHTVVGMFDDYAHAEKVVEKLEAAGINKHEIDISQRKSDRDVLDANKTHDERTGENSVTRFFRRLFNSDDDAEKYTRVAYESGTVVSVYVDSEVEANQAADIMDDNGAVDVEERASKFGHDWQRMDQPNTHQPSAHHQQHQPDHKTPSVTQESTHMGERTAPGTGVEETGGSRSKSRVIPWKGEASAKLREDRLTETKFW